MVVVIVVVVLVQTARSGHWRGKGAWQVGAGGGEAERDGRTGELGPFVGSNSVRLSGMPLCQCSQLSLHPPRTLSVSLPPSLSLSLFGRLPVPVCFAVAAFATCGFVER